MAITLAGSPSTVATSGSGTTGAMDSTVGPADLLLEFISALSGANNQGKDSLTNTWVDPSVYANNTSAHYVSINHVLAPTTGAAQTFTAQTSAFYQGIIAAAFKGVGSYQASSYTGASETGPATSHPASSGSMTPSADGALIVTMLAVDPASTPGTITVPSGFTQLATIAAGGSNWPMVVAYEIQTTATARTPTWTTANSVRSAGASKIFLPPSAPALSTPTGNATGPTQATAAFTTDTVGGNAFFLRRTGLTPASQATVASTGESQAVVGTGVQSRNMTAFTGGTPYYVDMTQTGAPGVVSAGPFTPSTLVAIGSPDPQTATVSAAFSWSGTTPSALVAGGIGTKTWSILSADGSGLSSINTSTGVPSGTATATPGTYHPVLRVTDSSTAGINPTGGGAPPQTIDLTLTLIVGASGAATAIVISNASPASGQVGQLSNNFTVGANGTITGTIAVTPNAGAGGGTFVPSSVNINSASPTATFRYLPASTGGKSVGVTNNGGLTNPGTVTYTVTPALATTLSVTLTTDGITPMPNLNGLKVAIYDQPTPDLWAGHAPIYATASGSTDAFGVLTCSIAGLTTLVPGALAGLSISNSDGTLTQGAAQRGYVGPAAVS